MGPDDERRMITLISGPAPEVHPRLRDLYERMLASGGVSPEHLPSPNAALPVIVQPNRAARRRAARGK